MDFLKKSNTSADDDIIELTDIIEKGSEDSTAKSASAQELDNQMDALFSKGNKESQPIMSDDMDADIDALLSQMQSAPASPSPATSSARALNPDEELQMPNMSEVDALLDGMDIPPQPSDSATAHAPQESGTSTGDMHDLDDILNGMLESKAPSAKVPPAPAESPLDSDLDALLGENTPAPQPKTATPAPSPAPSKDAFSLDDDLEALLGESKAAPVPPQAAPAAPKPAPAAPAPSPAPKKDDAFSLDDDLEALLSESKAAPVPPQAAPAAPKPAPAAPAPSPAPKKDDAFSLDDDLEALLAGNSPTTPSEAAPAAAPSDDSFSLDADLEALLAGNSPTSAPPAPSAPSVNDDPFSLDADLEALLASVEADVEPPAKSSPTAEVSHLNAPLLDDIPDDIPVDLSDLGDALDKDSAAPPTAPPLQVEEVVDMLDLAAPAPATLDMDSLLADLESSTPDNTTAALPQPAPPVPDTTTIVAEELPNETAHQMVDTVDIAMVSPENMADMPDIPVQPSGALQEDSLPELNDLAQLLDPSFPKAESSPRAHQGSHPSDYLNDVEGLDDLGDMTPTGRKASSRSLDEKNSLMEDLSLPLSANVPAAERDPQDTLPLEMDYSSTEFARAAQELLDEKVMLEASVGDVDTDAWMHSLDEVLEESQEATDVPELHALDGEDTTLDELLASVPSAPPVIDEPFAFAATPFSPEQPQSHATHEHAANPAPQSAYGADIISLQQLTEQFTRSMTELNARFATLASMPLPPSLSPADILEKALSKDSTVSHELQELVRTAVAAELKAHSPALTPASALESGADTTFALPMAVETAPHAGDSLSEENSPHEGDSMTEAPQQAPAAQLTELLDRLVTMEERMQILESALEQSVTQPALEAAEERIEALELLSVQLASQDSVDSAENRLQLLEDRLELIAVKEAQALADPLPPFQQNPPQSAPTADSTERIVLLEERINALEDGNKEARLQTVETRLDGQAKNQCDLEDRYRQLESHFHQEVEKAAAAAAARIIREEIAGLLAAGQ